jgi:hypothetical protein
MGSGTIREQVPMQMLSRASSLVYGRSRLPACRPPQKFCRWVSISADAERLHKVTPWAPGRRSRSSNITRGSVFHGLRGGWDIRHFARAAPKFYAKLVLKLQRLSQRFAIVVRYDHVHGDRETVGADHKGPVRIRLAFSGGAERPLYSAEPTGRGRQRRLRRSADADLFGDSAVVCDLRALTPVRCSRGR